MNTPPVSNEHVAPGCDLFTPRQIHDHKVNGLNEAISIRVLDRPGAGNANHRYLLQIPDIRPPAAPAAITPEMLEAWAKAEQENPTLSLYGTIATFIYFQNGSIADAGINGLTNEALLAVIIDRMRGFQSGPYACRENAVALTKLEEAMMWLQKRTRDRMARGVEGTLQK